MQRYFLTIDWCSKGNRGVFCDAQGHSFSKETEHTEDEMWTILDTFYMVLSPKSICFTEEQLKEYHSWIPLAEYSDQYGVALKT